MQIISFQIWNAPIRKRPSLVVELQTLCKQCVSKTPNVGRICRRTHIGHLLVIIWNILKELLNFVFLYKIFAFYNHFPSFNITYIIHKAKENNSGTDKISWSFSSDLICPAEVNVGCICLCMCDLFRTVNHMKHLEIPLCIWVMVELKPENIMTAHSSRLCHEPSTGHFH